MTKFKKILIILYASIIFSLCTFFMPVKLNYVVLSEQKVPHTFLNEYSYRPLWNIHIDPDSKGPNNIEIDYQRLLIHIFAVTIVFGSAYLIKSKNKS